MAEHEEHSKAEDKALIEEAHERFKQCQESESDQRLEAVEDLQFLNGDQWPEKIKLERIANGRPCHTINRLPQFVRQTTNPQRSNRVSAHVLPVDDKGDIDTAEVLQGIVRHIEVQSHAAVAYDTAAFYAAAMGWGYWHITSEYSSPLSFDQDILIKRIRNPFSVYLDPSLQEPDGSDAEFGFITEQFTKEEFEEAHPNADIAGLEDWEGHGDPESDWIGQDGGVRVVQYYYREYKRDKLLLVKTEQGPLPILESQAKLLPDFDEGRIIESRETKIPSIKSVKLNAIEVLERTDWPGLWIPIVKVIGDEVEIEGKLHLNGIIRFAKDPQRQLNYTASAETELIALAPKAPIVIYEGQIEGHRKEWAEANRKNLAWLEIRPFSISGQPAPFPQRLSADPNIGPLVNARREAVDDLSGVMGIYPPQLGAQSNETSGRAILARTQQGETTNFHYSDNTRRSVEHSCRILVNSIPHFYDTDRMIRAIGEDDEQKIVRVNKEFEENGKTKIYQLGAGKYDVICAAGPSYGSKRQAAAASMIELVRAYPALMEFAADLLFESLDIPKAQELAKRARKMLPPELQEGDQKPISPQVKAKMEQMGQMLEALTKELEKRTEEVQKLEGRQGIEMQKLDAQMSQLQLKLDSQEAIALLKVEIDALKAQLQVDVDEKARAASQTAQQI